MCELISMPSIVIRGRYLMHIKTDVLGGKILNTQRIVSDKVQETMNRLSTGLRINKAKDDAAGLSIDTRLSSQVKGDQMALRNIQDSISLLKTTESGIQSLVDHLQRIRELSVQSQNGTLSSEDKNSIQKEIDKMVESMNNIANKTSFNGIKTLNSNMGVRFVADEVSRSEIVLPTSGMSTTDYTNITGEAWIYWIGENSTYLETQGIWGTYSDSNDPLLFEIWEDKLRVRLNDLGVVGGQPNYFYSEKTVPKYEWVHVAFSYNSSEGTNGTAKLFINGENVGEHTGEDPSTITLNQDYQTLGNSFIDNRAFDGYIKEFRIWSEAKTEEQIKENMDEIKDSSGLVAQWELDKLNDGDTVVEDSSGNNNQGVINNAIISNTIDQSYVSVHTGYEKDNDYMISLQNASSNSLGINGVDVSDSNILTKVDSALDTLLNYQSKIGTNINRLEFKTENISNRVINTETAKSRISNADIAAETSVLVKNQLLMQTSLEMLKKNSANRESTLSLLAG